MVLGRESCPSFCAEMSVLKAELLISKCFSSSPLLFAEAFQQVAAALSLRCQSFCVNLDFFVFHFSAELAAC